MKYLMLASVLFGSFTSASTIAAPSSPTKMVSQKSSGEFIISKRAIERDIRNPMRELNTFSATPSFAQGPFSGLRLSGFTKDCLLPKFGLKNEDVVETVNGEPVRSPIDIMTIGRRLVSNADLREVKIRLRRGSQVLHHTYTLVR